MRIWAHCWTGCWGRTASEGARRWAVRRPLYESAILSATPRDPRERMTTPQQTGTDQISVRVTLFADLLSAIGIPAEDEVTVGLNGEQAARETVLRDGDDAVMFSPMEGG